MDELKRRATKEAVFEGIVAGSAGLVATFGLAALGAWGISYLPQETLAGDARRVIIDGTIRTVGEPGTASYEIKLP